MAVDRKIIGEKLEKCQTLFDVEKLDLFLHNGCKNQNTRELAEKLLLHFGTIDRVFKASYRELLFIDLPVSVARYISVAGRCLNFKPQQKFYASFKTREELIEDLVKNLGTSSYEVFEIIVTDKRGNVTFRRQLTSNNSFSVTITTDAFADIFIEAKNKKLYVAHNHIGGPPIPSKNDNILTQRLVYICDCNGIDFIDHIIVNEKGEYYSFLDDGKMELYKSIYCVEVSMMLSAKIAEMRAAGIDVKAKYEGNCEAIIRDFFDGVHPVHKMKGTQPKFKLNN